MYLAEVWKDAVQRPVEISQVFTIPPKSLVIVIPSFACRVMDVIGNEVVDVDFGLVATRSVDRAPICQNLTDLSTDAEIRVDGEENTSEVMLSVWPIKVSTRWGSELVMSQI